MIQTAVEAVKRRGAQIHQQLGKDLEYQAQETSIADTILHHA
jgi:hypothetical protein